MERQRGTVYTPADSSETTLICKCQVKDTTFEEFAASVDRHVWLAEEGTKQCYQTILTDPTHAGEYNPEFYGVFVPEGVDLKAVEVALAEEWGLDEVRLAEHVVHMVLEFPGRLSEEEIRAACQQFAEKYKILKVEMLS